MQSGRDRTRICKKRNQQTVTICNYYRNQLFPRLFHQPCPPPAPAKLKAQQRGLIYNYHYDVEEGVLGITPDLILKAAKSLYFEDNSGKMRQNSYQRVSRVQLPYLPISTDLTQQIDLYLITTDLNSTAFDSKSLNNSRRSSFCTPQTSQQLPSWPALSAAKSLNSEQTGKQDIFLYVLHYCSQEEGDLYWQNFIQRYHFGWKNSRPTLTHEICFAYRSESFFLSLGHQQRLLQSYFDDFFKGQVPIVSRMRQKVAKFAQTQKITINIEQQSPSFDPIHRRQLRLTPTQRQLFIKLRSQASSYFLSLNKQRKLSSQVLENTVCRLMQANNFQQISSYQAIKYYFDYEHRMRTTYSWSDFMQFRRMQIFHFVGKDEMGRPILLSRMRNVLFSQIKDLDKFLDFHFYVFEIVLQDWMEGWVDQFSVIGDLSEQCSDNTNISFSKDIIQVGYKLSLGRHFKVLLFDAGFLGYSLFNILKPFLPQKFSKCLKIFSSDRAPLLEEMRSFIPQEVIPQFLGGRNPTLETNPILTQLGNEPYPSYPKQIKNTENTSDRSIRLQALSSGRR